MRAGVNRVAAWYEQGRFDKIAGELRGQTRTLEQNRHLVPDDEVCDFLVGEGTALLEAMIQQGQDR